MPRRPAGSEEAAGVQRQQGDDVSSAARRTLQTRSNKERIDWSSQALLKFIKSLRDVIWIKLHHVTFCEFHLINVLNLFWVLSHFYINALGTIVASLPSELWGHKPISNNKDEHTTTVAKYRLHLLLIHVSLKYLSMPNE